ncbi:MAG: ribosome maturation factor RimP [Candidatus Bipolaricaulota bacterium]|nr:ribosome maturation factor RimP [Candidatus Bipolaricaulota bacterium]
MERAFNGLDALLRQGAAEAEVEVYHWELHRAGRRARLVVEVDRPGGVTLDDCVRASRAIDALLEKHDPVPGSYLLEVSSPGVERRLWEPRHYAQAVGKTVRVRMKSGGSHRGRLLRLEGDWVFVEGEGGPQALALAEIASAHLVYEQDPR